MCGLFWPGEKIGGFFLQLQTCIYKLSAIGAFRSSATVRAFFVVCEKCGGVPWSRAFHNLGLWLRSGGCL